VGGLLTAAEQEPGGVVPGHPARASAQSAPSQVARCERGAGRVHAAALAPPGGSTAARLGRARRGGRGRAGGLWRRVQRPRLGAGARVCAGRGGRGRARQRRAVRPFGSHSQSHAPPPHGGPSPCAAPVPARRHLQTVPVTRRASSGYLSLSELKPVVTADLLQATRGGERAAAWRAGAVW